MFPFQTQIAVTKNTEVPVYIQVSKGLIRLIASGVLPKATRLPGTRKMADLLDLHRNTIIKSYEELESQGWIEFVSAKGTFVSSNLPKINKRDEAELIASQLDNEAASFTFDKTDVYSFNINKNLKYGSTKEHVVIDFGLPDVRLAPTDVLHRNFRFLLKRKKAKLLTYSPPFGNPALRQQISTYLSETRGVRNKVENVMITRGMSMSIYLCANILLKPGDIVVMEEPNYQIAENLFKMLGAQIITIPVDDNGILVDEIEALSKKKKIRAIFITPHHQYPTTVTLSADRRMKLLALAVKHKIAILENDYDYSFRYDSSPLLPLASYDRNGVVIYFGSLSKTIAPAFRVGFLSGPRDFLIELAKRRRMIDRQGDNILEHAIALMFKEGEIHRYLRKNLKVYQSRRDYFCQLLEAELSDHIRFKKPEGGMAIWAEFLDSNFDELVPRLEKKGLSIRKSRFFTKTGNPLPFCRLGFASLSFEEMERAVEIFKLELG